MDVGGLIGANILAARGLGPIVKLAQMSEQFATARQALAMLREFMKAPRERADGTALARYAGGIEFQDLGFVHPGQRAPLFESMNLRVEPGALVVFGGSNGAGKTTLARLLVGLLEPSRGKILADGVDFAQIAPEWWRRQIMYLPQEPGFVNASIADHIRAANPALDEAGLNELARRAGLRPFIDQSPAGFDTPIAGNGANLSLGIRRRIALARALATDGMLMVIDEPTEGLDAEGARLVIDAMNAATKRGRTVIALTHDPRILASVPQYVDLNSKPVPRMARQQPAAGTTPLKPVREVGA
jgi:ATP-binding cassette subfamily C protein LapB